MRVETAGAFYRRQAAEARVRLLEGECEADKQPRLTLDQIRRRLDALDGGARGAARRAPGQPPSGKPAIVLRSADGQRVTTIFPGVSEQRIKLIRQRLSQPT